jgi:hypothetical protein
MWQNAALGAAMASGKGDWARLGYLGGLHRNGTSQASACRQKSRQADRQKFEFPILARSLIIAERSFGPINL